MKLSNTALQSSTEHLIKLLNSAHSVYHGIKHMEETLKDAGFKRIDFHDLQEIKEGDRFYLVKNDSALLVFSIGSKACSSLKIVGSHTDSPALKLKPQALLLQEGALCLNTEVYGGPILHTWFDRVLSLAGRVLVLNKETQKRETKLLDWTDLKLTIPSLAIHMNRKINEGVAIAKQKTLLPVLAMLDDTKKTLFSQQEKAQDFFHHLLLETLQLSESKYSILGHDLYFYDIQEPHLLGLDKTLLQAPKLDNLCMVDASLQAICQTKNHEGVIAACAFDNEEVGSMTQQGARSLLLREVLELIFTSLGASAGEFLQLLNDGLFISADLAHAVHPHYPECADPSHRPHINQGPVIKIAANQSYASDGKSIARFVHACQVAKQPYQLFVNHSDRPAGSTIGPMSSSFLTMPTVDIGNAIWAMHSQRETGGILDHLYLIDILRTFYAEAYL